MVRALLKQALEQFRREMNEDMAQTRIAAEAEDRRRDSTIQALVIDVEELKERIAEAEDKIAWLTADLGKSPWSW